MLAARGDMVSPLGLIVIEEAVERTLVVNPLAIRAEVDRMRIDVATGNFIVL